VATDAQIKTLVAKRKTTRPEYYNANDSETYSIPSVTEDALVLLGSETKREAKAYLNAYVTASPGAFTKDYNDLLKEFVDQQVANGEATVAELQQVTGKFNSFRTKLSGELNETNLVIEEGMQPIMEAMSKTLGRLTEIDRSEFFHNLFNSVMEAQYKQEVTDELKKELRSWIRVIASYP
jgi:hypothetical protein